MEFYFKCDPFSIVQKNKKRAILFHEKKTKENKNIPVYETVKTPIDQNILEMYNLTKYQKYI